MRGGAETVEAEALAFLRTAEAVGAVSDDAGTKQGGGVFVGEGGGKRVREVFANQTIFGVAPVDMVAGELRMLA